MTLSYYEITLNKNAHEQIPLQEKKNRANKPHAIAWWDHRF